MTDSVDALIAMAIAEDLADGVDITSVATIPEMQEDLAQFVNRKSVISLLPH